MQAVDLEYGDGVMPIELGDDAFVARPDEILHEPPGVDPVAATRAALDDPLGTPPIRELVGNGSTVAIAFPDRVKGGAHEGAHRRVALTMILEELAKAGVRDRDVTCVCAVGLHKQNTPDEISAYLPELADHPDVRVVNHDAEDPDGIVSLGTTEHGDRVEFNRTCAEADLLIVLGHVQGNPYGGFSGGVKTFTTGLTTWRSIAGHHAPATMHRPDFVPISTRSHFRDQLHAIGDAIEDGIAGRLLVVDAVVGDGARVLGTFAGAVREVEEASWPLAERRTNVQLDTGPADVLVVGLPRSFHYGPGMGTNPILMAQAIAAVVSRCAGAFRRGGVVIAAAQCDGWFNDAWFPSYRETWQRYGKVTSVAEMGEASEDICTRPEYVEAYREARSYHPFHAFSMLSFAEIAHQWASRIFVAGPEAPGYARSMGFTPVRTVDAALAQARGYFGSAPRVMVLPEFFTRVPPHLFAAR